MSKTATNLSIDSDIKQQSIELFADLGMDLSTAVNVFLRQAVRVQGFPFVVARDDPNEESIAAMNEYYLAKKHPEQAEKDQYISDMIEQLNELCDQIADLMETIEEDGVFSNWADMIRFLKEDIAL